MEFGILGLELSGKTTLFSLLTGHIPTHAAGKREAHVGIAQVPDHRLDKLTAMFRPKKHTPATVRFVDVPGVTRGGAAALNLHDLRTMDGLAAVIRGFSSEEVPHPEGDLDPVRDLELLETELLLADLQMVTNRLERLTKELAKRKSQILERELAALEKCRPALEHGTPLREMSLDQQDRAALKGFGFFSLKPLLVLLNAGELDAGGLDEALTGSGLAPWRERVGVAVGAVCATLEQEISRLSAEDQLVFLAELGLPDRALDRVLRAAYELLGLRSFFTVGDDECRAWTIRAGATALKAAGVVHSDFERGFIRAEVATWEELVSAGSWAACRNNASLRVEGKDYVVADGDVINIRFNV